MFGREDLVGKMYGHISVAVFSKLIHCFQVPLVLDIGESRFTSKGAATRRELFAMKCTLVYTVEDRINSVVLVDFFAVG